MVERLLQSLSASNSEIDQAWLRLARRRQDELASGKVSGIPGEDVFNRISRRFWVTDTARLTKLVVSDRQKLDLLGHKLSSA